MTDASSYPNGQPGWYQQHDGQLRWWDGYSWGPFAAAGAVPGYLSPSDSKLWATLAQATHFVLGWIGSLIIRQTKGKDDKFVKHHATEALNLSLTIELISLVLMIPFVASIVVAAANSSQHYNAATGRYVSDGPGPAFFIAFAVWMSILLIMSIYGLIVAILGIIATTQGKWYRYPIVIRFVRGAVSKEEAATLEPVGARPGQLYQP